MSSADALRELESACEAFLHATTPAERVAAEGSLMAFRQQAQPLPLCCYVLQASTMPYVQLQALYTLRESLGREWLTLSGRDRDGLQQLLLQLLTDGRSQEAYVGAAAAQLLAVHAKHVLLNVSPDDSDTMEALTWHAGALLEQPSEAHAAAATRLLITLITEFGAPTGGAAGGALSWASHARARLVFQQGHLLHILQLGLQHLERLTAAGTAQAATPPAQRLVLQQCAALLTAVLSWDFDGLAEAASVHGAAEGEARPGLDATTVRPPADQSGWRELLGRPQIVGWVMQQHEGLAQGPDDAEQTRHALRQLLVQLGSLSRRIFEADEAHAAYVQLLLGAASSLVCPKAASTESRALEFLDGASLLQRIVGSSGTDALLLLPPQLFQSLLELLHHATLESLRASLTVRPGGELPEAQAEAYDVLMEVWVSLLAGSRAARARGRSVAAGGADDGAFQMLDRAAWTVYEASLHARLEGAAALAEQLTADDVKDAGEEDATDEERHDALAVLGRSNSASAVGLLCGCLAERTERLQQFCMRALSPEGAQAPHAHGEAEALEALLEQLDVLVNCAAHLLADSSEGGDAAEPPPEVADAGLAVGAVGAHPVAVLVEAVHRLLQLQLQALAASARPDGALSAALSPLLGVSLLNFFRRVTASYLMPDEASCSVLSPPLLALWGRDTPGAASLLLMCVEAAATYLERWPSEPDLAHAACQLVAALSRLRAPRPGPAVLLPSLPPWGRLLALPLSSVQPTAERLLREALCRGAAAVSDDAGRLDALRAVCAPLPQRFHALLGGAAGSTHRRDWLAQPNVMLEVRGLCACLRGLACATTQASAPIVFETVGGCLPSLVGLLEPYAPAAEPLLHVLKVFRDMVAAQAAILPTEHARSLAEQAAALAAAYVCHVPPEAPEPAMGAADGGHARCSTSLISEGDRFEQMLTLLEMATHLAGRTEEGGESPEAIEGYGAALVAAVQHILPRISPTLLQYPVLCEEYFGFLSNLLENRPSTTAVLPAALYDAILASIQFGIGHHQTSICRQALESTYELARQASMHGGLAARMTTMLQTLLTRVLGDLLCSRLHPDLVDPAAGNALLALILAQQQHWQAAYRPSRASDASVHLCAQRTQRLRACLIKGGSPLRARGAHPLHSRARVRQVLIHSLLELQPTEDGRREASAAFGALLSTNGVAASLARPNRTRFRANLHLLLQHVHAGGVQLPR